MKQVSRLNTYISKIYGLQKILLGELKNISLRGRIAYYSPLIPLIAVIAKIAINRHKNT